MQITEYRDEIFLLEIEVCIYIPKSASFTGKSWRSCTNVNHSHQYIYIYTMYIIPLRASFTNKRKCNNNKKVMQVVNINIAKSH